jgi:hypothetical protein
MSAYKSYEWAPTTSQYKLLLVDAQTAEVSGRVEYQPEDGCYVVSLDAWGPAKRYVTTDGVVSYVNARLVTLLPSMPAEFCSLRAQGLKEVLE